MHASDVRHGGQKNSVKAQNVREAHLTVPVTDPSSQDDCFQILCVAPGTRG